MEITIKKKIILELTEDEAKWLREFTKVPLYSEETSTNKSIREDFYYTLSKITKEKI